MGHLSKTLPKARDHPQYRPKQAMQQERLAGFKEFVQSQWTGLLFGYSKRLGYGEGVFYVLKSGDITCSGEYLRGVWTPCEDTIVFKIKSPKI